MGLFKSEKLSEKAQKAVAAAKDALYMLNNNTLEARPGVCFRGSVDRRVSPREELRNVLKEARNCVACAVGSLFVACARVYDDQSASKFATDGGVSIEDAIPVLRKAFDDNQIALIEYSFEGGSGHFKAGSLSYAQIKAADRFYSYYVNDAKLRLKAICQNIINNDGVFTPSNF